MNAKTNLNFNLYYSTLYAKLQSEYPDQFSSKEAELLVQQVLSRSLPHHLASPHGVNSMDLLRFYAQQLEDKLTKLLANSVITSINKGTLQQADSTIIAKIRSNPRAMVKIEKGLDRIEYECARLWGNGYSCIEIAVFLNINPNQIHETMAKTRKKITSILQE